MCGFSRHVKSEQNKFMPKFEILHWTSFNFLLSMIKINRFENAWIKLMLCYTKEKQMLWYLATMIWCGTWISNLESYLLHRSLIFNTILTLIWQNNEAGMAILYKINREKAILLDSGFKREIKEKWKLLWLLRLT